MCVDSVRWIEAEGEMNLVRLFCVSGKKNDFFSCVAVASFD